MTNLMRLQLGVAAAALCVPGAVQAQTNASEQAKEKAAGGEGETIVITGRASVETPVEVIKQQSVAIVDAITAEEIDKTGDLNLAEALERVVGVSADGFYDSSEPGYVSLRGFDSRYNSIDVDGNPIWFSSQNNRGAQIGMIPSAIVKETGVYKTVTPDMDANSIGGHTSLRTLRAFDGGSKPYAKAGYRIGFYDQEGTANDGPSNQLYGAGKFTFGQQDQFGFVFGFNRQRTSNYDDYASVGGYTQKIGPDGELHDQIASNTFTQSNYDKTVRNTAVFAKLEARKEDELYAFLSGNVFDEKRFMYLQRAGAYIADKGSRTVTQTGDGTADFTNAQGQVREYDYDMERRATVIGFGVDYRVMDRGTIAIRGNYTDYVNDTLTRNLGGGFRISSFDGSYDINGDVPILMPNDPDTYNDPANWAFRNTANTSGSAAYNRDQLLEDDVYTLGAIFNYNNQHSAEGFGASAGVNWVRLDRSFNQDRDFWALNSGVSLTLADVVPAGSTMAGNAAAHDRFDTFWDAMYANGSSRFSDDLTSDYTLQEDILALHGAVTYASGGFRAMAGLRYEQTWDVTDTGQVVDDVDVALHRENDYGNFLPNVQVSYEATSRLKLRAAFTQTIGRPDFADFAPGVTTSYDAEDVPYISGSNGKLGPRKSTNFDASVEYYLDDGMLSLAVFTKKLDDETFDERRETYEGDELVLVETVPLNTGSARVRGIELSASKRHLDFLPGPLANFGLSANYTYLDGRWDVVFSDGTGRSVNGLRNQPEWMATARLSYDAGPLDLHLNYRARGRTFTGSFGTEPEDDRYVAPYDRLDLQATLQLTKNLRLKVDAINLTESYYTQVTGIEDSIYNTKGAGRSYWFGLRYSY